MNETVRIVAIALALSCAAALTACARSDNSRPEYLITTEHSIGILKAGLPADYDQDGLPDSLDPAPDGSGVSDSGDKS